MAYFQKSNDLLFGIKGSEAVHGALDRGFSQTA
jgi:hypothetical protein